jgi:NadR type nicotinamide-nucleotide adenylyltransferase
MTVATGRIVRVAILGAESSGKSTLASALAARQGSLWVPEFLREFVDTHQRVPHEEDQFLIASTQLQRERALEQRLQQQLQQQNLPPQRSNCQFLFCDTTPLMTALYSRCYFARIDPALEQLASSHAYDLTLVTAPDGPWVADGLQRESAAVRQQIHRQLREELAARAIAFTEVEGTLQQRLLQVEKLLSTYRCESVRSSSVPTA